MAAFFKVRSPVAELEKSLAICFAGSIHALELPVIGAKQLDAATASGSAVNANDEEGYAIGNLFLHAEAVTALARIERLQMCIQLRNQGRRLGRGRMLCCDSRCHPRGVAKH